MIHILLYSHIASHKTHAYIINITPRVDLLNTCITYMVSKLLMLMYNCST